jgi:Multicopper oxidase
VNTMAEPVSVRRAKTRLMARGGWEVVSIGMAHPFHIHGALFRILSIAGAPPPPHLAGWKDVALVEDRAELLVAFNQPATRDHPFMYHRHILEHEGAGLMGQYVYCARARDKEDDEQNVIRQSFTHYVRSRLWQ